MTILIIGGGNMGLTYAQSFVRSRVVSAEQLMILEHLLEKKEDLESHKVANVFVKAEDCLPHADIVILAVKPQDSPAMFAGMKHLVKPEQVFLSIMAGVRIETICEQLGVTKVIRAMPNLPAQVGQGMTAYTATDDVTRFELLTIQNLLATTGKTLQLNDELSIDAVTAISGSGPAYVFYFMQSMIDSAQQMGFSPSEAELLVVQTFTGAIDLYNKSTFSCQEWIQRVSSRGGTTEAAIAVYNKQMVKDKISDGAFAALSRARELGK